jgi:hypothetical protein
MSIHADAYKQTLRLHVATALDVPLLVDPVNTGETRAARLGDYQAAFHPPRFVGAGETTQVEPPLAFASIPPAWASEAGWGRVWHGGTTGAVAAFGFTIELGAPSPERDLVAQLKSLCVSWRNSFCRLALLLLNQPLDLTDPAPGLVNHPGMRVLAWIEATGARSRTDSVGGPIVVHVPSDSIVSELRADRNELDRIVALVNRNHEVPIAVELLAAALLAIQRNKLRAAIIDAASAAESVLTQSLELAHDHSLTLGRLVSKAAAAGLPLPTDLRAVLVDPRNDAVHRGVSPSRATALRAAGIVEDLVASSFPEYAKNRQLACTSRPARHDLLLIS